VRTYEYSQTVFEDMEAERQRQIARWGTEVEISARFPTANDYAARKLVIAVEEVGEVARAILEREPLSALYTECIQTAAVFVAMAEGVLRYQFGAKETKDD